MTDLQARAQDADRWGVVPQRLRPPRLQDGLVSRARLLERLRGSRQPCLTLRAGAGYGKTTLLRQWIDLDDRPVAWIGVDPSDDDPVVLLRHLVRALADDGGRDLTAVEQALASREPLLDQEVLPALARALDRDDHPFVLVLDDVHLLRDPRSVGILHRMLDGIPDGSVVALAGRSLPPLGLARRRLDGTMLELLQDDLAFDHDEAVDLVHTALPALGAAGAEALVERTEGWPAGVALGILALRDHPDPPVLLAGLLAEDHRVADYLHEEVLDQVRPEVREFLLRAAVLDRLSGNQCDEVLGRTDSRALLDELVASGNHFVVAVDTDPDAFRLHHLFSDLLVTQLRRAHPSEERRIRRRAAEWHDARGESDPAVRHALATGDTDFATAVLVRQLFPALVRGQAASLRRWIDDFPPQRLPTDGLLALCAGWVALVEGRRLEFEHLTEIARAHPCPGPLPDGTVSFEVALAALEMTASLDGVKATAAQAAVVRAAGPGGSPWWTIARLSEAVSLGLAGSLDPVAALAAVEVDSRGAPAVHVVTLAQLGLAQLRAGDDREGQRTCRAASEELRLHRLEGYSLATVVHCIEAYAAARRGDRASADQAAGRARIMLGRMSSLVPRAMAQGWLALADAAVQLGDEPAARAALQVAGDRLVEEPDAVVLHDWHDEVRTRLDRRRGDTRPALSAAEQRVLRMLPTHRSLGEIGELLFVSRNTIKTHTLSIYRKLGVSSRSEAVDEARRLGLIDDPV
jgi:LuxR family maltose regulon positive regulatory protein